MSLPLSPSPPSSLPRLRCGCRRPLTAAHACSTLETKALPPFSNGILTDGKASLARRFKLCSSSGMCGGESSACGKSSGAAVPINGTTDSSAAGFAADATMAATAATPVATANLGPVGGTTNPAAAASSRAPAGATATTPVAAATVGPVGCTTGPAAAVSAGARAAARIAPRLAREALPPWDWPPGDRCRRGAKATRAVSTNIARPPFVNHGAIVKSTSSGSSVAKIPKIAATHALQSSPAVATPHAPEFHSRGARFSTLRPTAYA
mmetsp:Transcript_49697/g.113770  ORF Transcript_49697/g.113770 Transcript_49697/m.113770 type:complete len:266 (+) Transcript_49697:55-852(+)